jgi:hypothetical protein
MATKGGTPSLTPLPALEQAAECLRALAHPHRLRMVQMLLRGRYAVGELAEACDIPSHMASEHLRLMQRCGFLSSERGPDVSFANCGLPGSWPPGWCGGSTRRRTWRRYSPCRPTAGRCCWTCGRRRSSP